MIVPAATCVHLSLALAAVTVLLAQAAAGALAPSASMPNAWMQAPTSASPLGVPNCRGCYDSATGQCQLDTDPDACTLDLAECASESPPLLALNNSMDEWPTGCLVELVAKGRNCMGLLEKHDCSGGAMVGDNFTHCKQLAVQYKASL